MPTTTEIKTEPSPNNGNDVTELPFSPVLTPSDDYRTVSTEFNPTQQKATERPKLNRTQTLRYQPGFPWWGDVVTSLPTTENTIGRSLPYTEHWCKLHSLTEQRWLNQQIPSEILFYGSVVTRTLLLHYGLEINQCLDLIYSLVISRYHWHHWL